MTIEVFTPKIEVTLTKLVNRGDNAAERYRNARTVLWHEKRMHLMMLMNRDNSAFEEGSATAQGGEELKAGRNFRLTRGGATAEAYMIQVMHTFAPLRTWTTNVTLERGAGFLERRRFEGDPYRAEGRSGPYSAS